MNLAHAEQIARAVLYEGYMLYPYRPSSVKNRQRFNFGVLYPQAYSEGQDGTDGCSLRTECLVRGTGGSLLEVRLRFLQLQLRCGQHDGTASMRDGWHETVEREVAIPAFTLAVAAPHIVRQNFGFPAQTTIDVDADAGGEIVRRQSDLCGDAEVVARQIQDDLFKVTVDVRNTSTLETSDPTRDSALMQSLVSMHAVLGVSGGEFVSLLEPPPELQELAGQCRNIGVWPVLVGDANQCDTVLASPIILYDYPQIAPESAGDLFDGTEIDEILSLRIMTLTDEEKREIRGSDERARQILERTDNMPAEQFMKLHGAVRGLRPLKESTP
jgi:hydrogenase maturation protease